MRRCVIWSAFVPARCDITKSRQQLQGFLLRHGRVYTGKKSWSLAPFIHAVQAMCGVGLIVAVTLASEVGYFNRFDHPRQLMAYLGLVPSEHSSGTSISRGGITKAGMPWLDGC